MKFLLVDWFSAMSTTNVGMACFLMVLSWIRDWTRPASGAAK